MEASFGLFYFDPRRRVERNELERIGSLLGLARADIHLDGSVGIAVHRTVRDPGSETAAFAVDRRGRVAALTGEIDNRAALGPELRAKGLLPDGDRDGDVLLALYESRGVDLGRALNGFFNAFVWDSGRREIALFSDRCGGIRTGTWHRGVDFFAFASTARGVVGHAAVPRELDRDALEEAFVLTHPFSPRTLFRHVSILEAGGWVRCRAGEVQNGRQPRTPPKFWPGADLASLEHEYFAALQSAVERCARGNDRPAVLLSGGVDSATVVSLLRRAGARRIRTFSVHIGDDLPSDRAASLEIARRYETEHHSLDDLDARCLDRLPDIIWNFESVGRDLHQGHYLWQRVREECAEGDAVLSGQGNDLIWGCWIPKWKAGRLVRSIVPAVNEIVYVRTRRRMRRAIFRQLCPWAPASDFPLVRRLLPFRLRTGSPLQDFIVMDESLIGNQYCDREIGKLTDAHGLWPRLPFADATVMRLAESVPPGAKLRIPGPGRKELKSFFKDLMHKREVLPEEVIYRRKRWMYTPTADWFRTDLRETIRNLLFGGDIRNRGLFDPGCLNRLFEEHCSGQANHSHALGMVIGTEVWHRLFIDPQRLARPDRGLAAMARDDPGVP